MKTFLTKIPGMVLCAALALSLHSCGDDEDFATIPVLTPATPSYTIADIDGIWTVTNQTFVLPERSLTLDKLEWPRWVFRRDSTVEKRLSADSVQAGTFSLNGQKLAVRLKVVENGTEMWQDVDFTITSLEGKNMAWQEPITNSADGHIQTTLVKYGENVYESATLVGTWSWIFNDRPCTLQLDDDGSGTSGKGYLIDGTTVYKGNWAYLKSDSIVITTIRDLQFTNVSLDEDSWKGVSGGRTYMFTKKK